MWGVGHNDKVAEILRRVIGDMREADKEDHIRGQDVLEHDEEVVP